MKSIGCYIGIAVSTLIATALPPPAAATCTRTCAATPLLNNCTSVGIAQGWPQDEPLRIGLDCTRRCCSPVGVAGGEFRCSWSSDSLLAETLVLQPRDAPEGSFAKVERSCGFEHEVEYDRPISPGRYRLGAGSQGIALGTFEIVDDVNPAPEAEAYRVSGYATLAADCDGPPSGGRIELQGETASGEWFFRIANSVYSFDHVPPGEYDLRIAGFGRGQDGCWERKTVVVTDRDLEVLLCGCPEVDGTPTPTLAILRTPTPAPGPPQPSGRLSVSSHVVRPGTRVVLDPAGSRADTYSWQQISGPFPHELQWQGRDPAVFIAPPVAGLGNFSFRLELCNVGAQSQRRCVWEFATIAVLGPEIATGDCDGDGRVSIADLLTAVAIQLGETSYRRCMTADANGDANITVDELVSAVQASLAGL